MPIKDKIYNTLEALKDYFTLLLIIIVLLFIVIYSKFASMKLNFRKKVVIHPKAEDVILKEANALLKANNTVTTLEIKNKLRASYPQYTWNQNFISHKMMDFSNRGIYSFTDNGTFRTYSLIKKQKTTNNMTKTKISRTKALEMIQSSKGKFFTVKFESKKGEREMNCQYNSKTVQGKLGYITVTDVNLREYRNINLQTLKELRINKKDYRVS